MLTKLFSCLTITALLGFVSNYFIDSSNAIIPQKTDHHTSSLVVKKNKGLKTPLTLQDSFPRSSKSRTTIRSNDNGEKVYLSVIDGEIKKLKINNTLISKKDYPKYAERVEKLLEDTPETSSCSGTTSSHKKALKEHERAIREHEKSIEKHKKQVEKHEAAAKKNKYTTEAFLEELWKDGLISNKEKFNFYLSLDKFETDGKVQSDELKEKYIQLYQQITGNKITESSTYEVTYN